MRQLGDQRPLHFAHTRLIVAVRAGKSNHDRAAFLAGEAMLGNRKGETDGSYHNCGDYQKTYHITTITF